MATTDIQITVDAAAIAQQVQNSKLPPGTPAKPTHIGSYSESMIYIAAASQNGNNTGNNQQQPKLSLQALKGDTVHWTINAFENADNTVYLYNGLFRPGNIITSSTFQSVPATNYLPPSGEPETAPAAYKNQCTFARSTVIKAAAQVEYTCCFMVVNNTDGSIVGYFSWSALIHIID